MSYTGLGTIYNISTPVGKTQIDIPIETIAKNAAELALKAAWGPVESKLKGFLPVVIDQGLNYAIPKLKAEIPGLMTMAVDEVQPELRGEIDRALKIGTNRILAITSALALIIVGTSVITWTRDKKG